MKKTFLLKFQAIYLIGLVLMTLVFVQSCKNDDDVEPPYVPPAGTTMLPASEQREGGDSDKGWDYLRYGSYIGAGVPYDIFGNLLNDTENVLQRTGDNETLPPGFNAFTTDLGANVVGGITCMGCHGAKIDGQFIPGLGNSFFDFTGDFGGLYNFLEPTVAAQYDTSTAEWKSFAQLNRGIQAVSPYIQVPIRGINPAFMLEEASVAHRNPDDLTWVDDPLFEVSNTVAVSDVPALWNVKKKNTLYYTALGRGDFTKLLMQVMVVAIKDSAEARVINDNFEDVLAWINQLEPPKYTQAIDQTLAVEGKLVYDEHCEQCHGRYGDDEFYPNLLVNLNTIGTDPAYALHAVNATGFGEWFNDSWISRPPYPAQGVPGEGYVAPPLDGVWATAPYLHNGSVPTLEDLLNSSQRPTYWKRTFDDTDYDYNKIGWNYTVETAGGATDIYDTTIDGYKNIGHYYGDGLTDTERDNLMEYLKTL